MAKELCIWNKQEEIVRFIGKPEEQATYEQMISAGWKRAHNEKGEPMEGNLTIIFQKEN